MDSLDKTMSFKVVEENENVEVNEVLTSVYASLKEKGYNPINQIVGYLISGDPAYIPRHQDARNMIRRIERDDVIEELVRYYLENNGAE